MNFTFRSRDQRPLRRGFTLIELLVVVAIISVLASMLLPALGRARETSKRAVCASNLKQMYIGAAMYNDDNDEWAPVSTYWGHDPSIYSNSSQAKTNLRPYSAYSGGVQLPSPLYSTALYHMAQIKYWDAELMRCPSQSRRASITSAGLPNGWMDYTYRYNSRRACYKAGRYTYERNVMSGQRNRIVIAGDAMDYRRDTNGLIITTPYTGQYKIQQWAHKTGGNVVDHQGAIKFAYNWYNIGAPYSFPNNSYPDWARIDAYLAKQ